MTLKELTEEGIDLASMQFCDEDTNAPRCIGLIELID